MNPHNDSNIKNMAWIESDMLLYDTCTENTGKAIFEGYKPDVYRNMLALHLNGVNLEDSIVLNVLKPSQNYEVQTEK